jgi:uncharacterized repeat protein (TIGR01451 family)
MYRKKMFALAFAVCGFSVAAIVHAQNNDDSSQQRTLSDRFQELRDSFAGRRTAQEGSEASANTSSARRPVHGYGRPARVVRKNKTITNNFQQPGQSFAEPTDAPARVKPEEKPVKQSPFSHRPNSFSATPGDAQDSDSGSSRRRTGLKRIGSDPAPSESKPVAKQEETNDAKPEQKHTVYSPSGSDTADSSDSKPQDTSASPAADNPFAAAKLQPERPIAAEATVKSAFKAAEPTLAEEDLLTTDLLIATESPALSVRTAGPRKIMVGREALFEVKIQNTARSDADGVVVSVDLPEWAEVSGTEPTSGTAHPPQTGADPQPLQWHIGHIAGNSRETLRLKIVPRKSLPFDLGVHWTFTPQGSQAKVEVQEPKLTMRISGADEVRYGQTETYRLIIGNPGTGAAEDVVVNLLPNGPGDQAVASVKLGTIDAGEEIVREIAVTPREQGELRVRAEAVAAGDLSAKVDQHVVIRRAAVEVEAIAPKIRYSGTDATFTVKLTNTGNYMAQNVMVKAKLPSGAKYVRDTAAGSLDKSKQELTWRVISLPAGATKQMQVVCSLTNPGVNHLNIAVVGSDDIDQQTVASTRVDALADLRMTVVDPQGPVPTSEEATYQIRIVNRGNKAAAEIDVVVFFSAGMEPVVAEGATHRISEGQVTFNRIKSIAAGEERVLKVRAKAKQGGSHILRAELVCGELETKLAVEETTRFYDESSQALKGNGLHRQASSAPLRRVPTEKR